MSHSDCNGCAEYRSLSRRQFLAGGGAAAAMIASAPAWLPRVAFASEPCGERDVVLQIYLRGGADGLTLCVPHGDANYYAARPTLAVAPPNPNNAFAAKDLDGFFGFPPALAPLLDAFADERLLVVHATGSTDPSRSHFDAQRFMEVGKPQDPALYTGWLGRHLATVPPMTPGSVLRGVGLATGLQRTLVGGPNTLPIPNLDNFGITGNAGTLAARRDALSDMYATVGDPLAAVADVTLQTIDLLNTINFAGYVPAGGAVYPGSAFGLGMKSTAALLKAQVGVEAVAIDVGGWDTHSAQGSTVGQMANLMTDLAGGLSAFYTDLWSGSTSPRITVIVMTEFGRRVDENGSGGSDHGHGGAMLLLGQHIHGGRVLTHWPGLAPGQLFEQKDLEVTIDYRDVLAEIVARRLGNGGNLGAIFPGHSVQFAGVTTPCELGGGTRISP